MENSNDNKRKHIILQTLCNIISQEFIRESSCGVCLPATLILCEQATKFGIVPDIKCGKLSHEEHTIPVHFWIVVDGVIYDPTIKMALVYLPEAETVAENCLYLENQQKISTWEDQLMVEIYRAFVKTRSSEEYFSHAPEYLLRVKKQIEDRLHPLLKKHTFS